MGQSLPAGIAIITGSDSGIGQATAVEFARQGAAVLIQYFEDEHGARSTLQQVEGVGGKAIVVQADVRSESDVKRIFDVCTEQLGLPTVLVNSAGVDASGKHIDELSFEDFKNAIATNLFGPFMTCREFVIQLKKAKNRGA